MSQMQPRTPTPSPQRKLGSSAFTRSESHWIPAFAGMTVVELSRRV
jgi:hypothetical protein